MVSYLDFYSYFKRIQKDEKELLKKWVSLFQNRDELTANIKKFYDECGLSADDVSVEEYQDNFNNTEKIAYIKAKRIREDSGCVDIKDIERNEAISRYFKKGGCLYDFFRIDENGKYYTLPGKREELDSIIKIFDENYIYNPYLYGPQLKTNIDLDDIVTISLDNIQYNINGIKDNIMRVKVILNEEHKGFKSIDKFNINEVLDKLGKSTSRNDIIVIFEKFDASMMIFKDINMNFYSSEKIRKVIFACEADFSNCVILGQEESGNNKEKSFVFENYEFDCTDIQTLCLNFRNTRFLCNAEIRDIVMNNTNHNQKISFEDARIDRNLEIVNSFLGDVQLYCFQMIMGNYVSGDALDDGGKRDIVIKDVTFTENSKINMHEIEMRNGKIKIFGLKALPKLDLYLFPCQNNNVDICPEVRVLLKKCNIVNNVNIGNIYYFMLEDVINNGVIVENANWSEISSATDAKKYKKKSKGSLFKAFKNRTSISSKLLRAVYNYYNDSSKVSELAIMAKAFVVLKNNFANMGQYDNEDTAWILYMETKINIEKDARIRRKHSKSERNSFMESIKCLVYKNLYFSGKYGISIIGVLSTIVIEFIQFWLLFVLSIGVFKFGDVNIGIEYVNYNLWFKTMIYSIDQIVPFASTYEPTGGVIMILSIIERFIGLFLVGYFSIAVVRRTLK